MALFDDALAQEIAVLVHQRHQALSAALGISMPEVPPRLDEQSPLYYDLTLLIRIANGECHRLEATKSFVHQVEQALRHLLDLLLGNAWRSNLTIPDGFWRTDIGILVSRVRWWLSVDDLITISNAAALAFGENTQANRMRIARAIDQGLLEWVPDPSVANPQQNRRVLRPQVERLRDQRQLPGV